jgi:acyl-coenzyme A synthetase/AMP-(fatty) acid ligase
MVPRSVVVLDALPLTVNGKTAKAGLRAIASRPDPVRHVVG